jgi:hypothetical protein
MPLLDFQTAQAVLRRRVVLIFIKKPRSLFIFWFTTYSDFFLIFAFILRRAVHKGYFFSRTQNTTKIKRPIPFYD